MSALATLAPAPEQELGPGTPTILRDLTDGSLRAISDTLDSVEALHLATSNRLRSLTSTWEMEDGRIYGSGLSTLLPEVALIESTTAALAEQVHACVLELKRRLPNSTFQLQLTNTKGVGEKQGARLIAAIGDPYWNGLEQRPRTVSELWAYCGYSVQDGHAQRRRKGVKSNWSSVAKSRAYLISESALKQRGDLYDLYREVRESLEGAEVDGKPITKGHAHSRAMRRVSKKVLKDLWIVARDAHHAAE